MPEGPPGFEPDPVIEAYKQDAPGGRGAARLTLDLDVVYRRSTENHARLVRALAPHHPYLRGAPAGLPFQWGADVNPRGPRWPGPAPAAAPGG